MKTLTNNHILYKKILIYIIIYLNIKIFKSQIVGNFVITISSLQLLKQYALFLKHFKTLDTSNFNTIKLKIYQELSQIFFDSKNTIYELVNLLTEYIKINNLNWNINNLNDTNDFIYLIFNIIEFY